MKIDKLKHDKNIGVQFKSFKIQYNFKKDLPKKYINHM